MAHEHKTVAGLLVTFALAATQALAQSPWTVTLTPTLNPLPVGMCGAVHLKINDPAIRDVPRNLLGYRITMADFDMSVAGASVAGMQIDAYHYAVCGCPGGAPGGPARVIATYPAKSLAANAIVKDTGGKEIRIVVEAPFALAEPKGSIIPPPCAALSNNSGSIAAAPSPGAVQRQPADPFAPAASNPSAQAGNATSGATAPTGMVNPSGLTAVQIGPGQVQLSWQPVAMYNGLSPNYAVRGPGLLQATPLQTETTATASDLVIGRHEWSVGTAYTAFGQGALATTPEEFPKVSVDVRAWTVTPATAVNPSGFTPQQTGPNTVALRWQPVSGVAYYVLSGPGLPQGGVKVAKATQYTATPVPEGDNEWAVGSYYEPGPVSTAASNFSRAWLNVTGPASANTAPTPPVVSTPTNTSPNNAAQTVPPSASGRYLVTILGFRAYAVSSDDPLSRDGFGDEGYAAAYIRRYDRRTEQLIAATSCRTRTYGDVAVANSATIPIVCNANSSSNNQADVASNSPAPAGQPRIQGGTWMPTGGIKDYDMIPNGPAVAARNQIAKDNAFPWRLWDGPLVDGVDALVITPSIWEQDGTSLQTNTVSVVDNTTAMVDQALQQQTKAFYNQWLQQQQVLDSSIFGDSLIQGQIAGKRFGMVAAGAQPNMPSGLGSAFFPNPLATLLASVADRPIGLVSSGPGQTALPNRVVVLTREIIEAALAGPALGVISSTLPNVAGVAAPVRGIIMVPFYDGQMPGSGLVSTFVGRRAMYQMFIQVERLP